MRLCLMTSYIKYILIFKCVDLNTVFGINYKNKPDLPSDKVTSW